MVKIVPDKQNKLIKDSTADCFQIRSISEERCVRELGEIDLETMGNIRKALAAVLNIE